MKIDNFIRYQLLRPVAGGLGVLVAALFMIEGGGLTDLIGLALAGGMLFVPRVIRPDPDRPIPVRGTAD